jgi:protein-S-isoprenylcysteine O-methyltransferase Ste14
MALNTNILEGLYLLVIFGSYVLLWSLKRRNQRTQTGLDPEVLFMDSRASQRWFTAMTKIMTGAIIVLILIHSTGIDALPGFYRFNSLDVLWMNHLGLVVALLGLSLCLLAQKTMGASWRVGIDTQNQSALITHGIYGFIRNPTYTGLFIMCSGVFLILPTFSIITWILLFYTMIEFQVRLEEEHLLSVFKETYEEYVSRTKRYFPFVY